MCHFLFSLIYMYLSWKIENKKSLKFANTLVWQVCKNVLFCYYRKMTLAFKMWPKRRYLSKPRKTNTHTIKDLGGNNIKVKHVSSFSGMFMVALPNSRIHLRSCVIFDFHSYFYRCIYLGLNLGPSSKL